MGAKPSGRTSHSVLTGPMPLPPGSGPSGYGRGPARSAADLAEGTTWWARPTARALARLHVDPGRMALVVVDMVPFFVVANPGIVPNIKRLAQSLHRLRASWRADAVRRFGVTVVDGLLARARAVAAVMRARLRGVVVDVAAAAAYVTAVVAVMWRGRFRRRHLLAEARRHLAHTLQGAPRVGPGPSHRRRGTHRALPRTHHR